MRRRETYSIRRRLIWLCIIPILAILCIMMAFYAYFTATNEARAWETFQSMTESTKARLNSEMTQVSSLFNTVGYNKNLQDYLINQTQAQKFERFELIQQNMQLMADTVPWVENLYIRSEKWSIAHTKGGIERFAKALIEYELWSDHAMNGTMFTHPYTEVLREGSRHYVYAMTNAQPLASASAARHAKPFLVGVEIDLESFLNMFRTSDVLHMIMYDSNVLVSDGNIPATVIELAKSMGETDKFSIDFHPIYYASGAEIGETGCRFVMLVEKKTLQGSMEAFLVMSAYAVGIVCVIIVLLLLFIMRGIMHPIMFLARDMQAVINGAERVRPSDADEMRILSDGINYMLANLQLAKHQEFEMRENVYQLQLQQSQAEMIAYRNQINPHFFFNTLECMCSMARYFKVKPLEELAEAMSKNFAYSLRESLYVPLEKEIQHVRNYMHIMDIRCPDKYQLRVQCAEETGNIQVLSLLLQPLVENAVSHGFRKYDKNAPCTIDLRTDIVENNGKQYYIKSSESAKAYVIQYINEIIDKQEVPFTNIF